MGDGTRSTTRCWDFPGESGEGFDCSVPMSIALPFAAVIEAVMGDDLVAAQLKDPDLPAQTMTPRRALAELGKIRRHHLHAGGPLYRPR